MTSILITTEKVIGRRILTSYRYKSSTASPIVKSGYETLNCDTPYNLVFLRHGQSTWNRDNRFIGWTDTPLTEDGVLEARVAGQMLEKSGVLFDEVGISYVPLNLFQRSKIIHPWHFYIFYPVEDQSNAPQN